VRIVLGMMLLSACATRTQNAALFSEIQDLRVRVANLEEALGMEPEGDPAREAEAMIIAMRAREALDNFQMELGRELVEQLAREYPDTSIGRSAQEYAEHLSVIGMDAGTLDVTSWLTGEASYQDDRLTFVVFMEAWCPHCQREAPLLQERHQALASSGIDVVGITSLSRGTSEAEMRDFIDTAGITFPFGVEAGDLSERYRVQGVPSAVVIRGGKVIWTGHPSTMTAEVLTSLLTPS
jgi:thiol-disulfide isomerase/thioredoxin